MKRILLAIILLYVATTYAFNPWQKIDLRNTTIEGERRIVPDRYMSFSLDIAAFNTLIDNKSEDRFIELPTPNGSYETYRIIESSCMEKQLADKYPMIQTFRGVNILNPSITASFDITTKGFHAMIFHSSGTYFIDPYTDKNIRIYNCYYKNDYNSYDKHMNCMTGNGTQQHREPSASALISKVSDNKKRILRLALSCTVEYAKAVDGPTPTKAGVLSAMVTSINRINGIYEKELAIHMNLVANNDTLIFLSSDPFSNNDGFAMLDQNQTVVDNRIKSANYDIGHVFSTGGGGIAGLGVVCVNGAKANGVTGSTSPIGDAFDVDYVAHEMGHQFGANHTFNAGTGSCAGNRNSSTAYEIGSGTTIMSYAGICNNNDIALHSDDYFHRISLIEIMDYISTTSCAQIVSANSIVPQIADYTATYYIPYKTNFELPALAYDPDGDPISYCWEQSDLGAQGNWNNPNNIKSPLFRSFLPTANNIRIFPAYDQIINNVIKYRGEVLPEVARDVKFKCTVRENRGGWGQFNAPDQVLLLKSIVTPTLFRITNVLEDTIIKGNSILNIRWDTTSTTLSPISCSKVTIYLSLDSAATFPIVLATETANDGIEDVIIPDISTVDFSARIKIKATNNVFFDYNDGRVKIDKGEVLLPIVDFSVSDTSICVGDSISYMAAIIHPYDSVLWHLEGTTPSYSHPENGTALFTEPGVYAISLTVYKSDTSIIKTRIIEVHALPNILITPTQPSVCLGDTIQIEAQYLEGSTCIWSTGGSTSIIEVSPTEQSSYSVQVTDSYGCINQNMVTVIVNNPSEYSISHIMCEGDTLYLGSDIFTQSGEYSVVLTNSVGCDSTIFLQVQTEAKLLTPVITRYGDTIKVENISASAYQWYLDGILFATSSLPYLLTTDKGIWTVVAVTDLGCESDVSAPYILTSVKNNFVERFSILPNPNTGDFTIEIYASRDNKVSYSIINMLGEKIMSRAYSITEGRNTIPVSILGYPKGIYLLNITYEDNAFSKSFAIE